MPGTHHEILLVTPVWKDSTRLAVFGETLATVLSESSLAIRWVIADDGTGGDEHLRLDALREKFAKVFPKVQVHLAARHYGKGSVIREAWALAPDAAWYAFVDADGSVTADEMLELIEKSLASGKSSLGIRKRTATTQIVESPWRGIAHRGFLLAAHLILDLQCEDVQCGAKVIKGSDYRAIADRLFENGLAFDSELLSSLKRSGASWNEIPVNWTEKKGGKVKPIRDAWGMLAALWRIRWRSMREDA